MADLLIIVCTGSLKDPPRPTPQTTLAAFVNGLSPDILAIVFLITPTDNSQRLIPLIAQSDVATRTEPLRNNDL